MNDSTGNAKWLRWFAPFRTLSISAAYLAPFFIEKGISQSQIFLIQSVFSLAYLLWEIPSGYIADRFGRAPCMKISAPIAAVAMIYYSQSTYFWQFIVAEIVLALANGLVSGVDTALLYDSLAESSKESDFVRDAQRIVAFAHGGTALGVPIAILLVAVFGVSSTLMADGLLLLAGTWVVWQLKEPRRHHSDVEAGRLTVYTATKQLIGNVECRWLITFGAVLATSTYLAAWLAAPYYTSLHIPLVAFAAIYGLRSLYKAMLAHRVHSERHLRQRMISLSLLAGMVYFAMASGQIWLLWVVLGHDTIQALQDPPLERRLNQHISAKYRATMNSVSNLVRRSVYMIAGPLAGLVVDRFGLRTGLVLIGTLSTTLAALSLARLLSLGSFQEGR